MKERIALPKDRAKRITTTVPKFSGHLIEVAKVAFSECKYNGIILITPLESSRICTYMCVYTRLIPSWQRVALV